MAALVQSFPPPSSTITMLQSRPSSSDTFQNGSTGQQNQRGSQMPRNMYNMGGLATTNYRGHTSIASMPVAPYAFSTTPGLPSANNPLRQHPTISPHLRHENRTSSAPAIPLAQQTTSPSNSLNRYRQAAGGIAVDPSNSHTLSQQANAKEDTSILSQATRQFAPRPQSAVDLGSPSPLSSTNIVKSSPDRYRRAHRRADTAGVSMANASVQGGSALPSGSGMASVAHLYSNPAHSNSSPSLSTYTSYHDQGPREHNTTNKRMSATVDDLNLPKQHTPELAKRYRRRSISSMDAGDYKNQSMEASVQVAPQPKTYAATLASPVPQDRKETRAPGLPRPDSAHGRTGSAESSVSGRSGSRPPSVCLHFVPLIQSPIPATVHRYICVIVMANYSVISQSEKGQSRALQSACLLSKPQVLEETKQGL